uniref:G_PROTEIN_RECEP_F1_2 domain-containing protein n=1 Tax=Haemonchus contortus TaxID=6289 RepID=A0A7I5E741_HAECO
MVSDMNSTTNDSLTVEIEEPLYLSLIEAGAFLLISIVGIFCNLLAFTVMIRHQSFKNAFGRLATCYTFSNIGILIIFIVWTTPWTIWMIPSGLHYINLRIGSLTIFFYQVALHCHLFISINRFFAITFPIRYRKMFTLYATNVIIAFFATASFLYSCVYFIDGCDFFYIHSPPGWTYSMEPCTQVLALYVDYYYNYFIFFVFLALDVITIVQLRSRRRKVLARQQMMNGHQAREDAKKESRELRFLAQAALSTFTNLVLYCCGCFAVKDPRFQLLCYSLCWQLIHALAGVIFVAFNPEIRRHLPLMKRFSPGTMTAAAVSVRPVVTTTAETNRIRIVVMKSRRK